MNGNHQEPNLRELEEAQLTAYALDQLDANEEAAVEARLLRSEKGRQWVEQARAIAGFVVAGGRDAPPMPSSALREAVEQRLHQSETTRCGTLPERPRRRRLVRFMAVAAALLIAAIPFYLVATSPQAQRRELAVVHLDQPVGQVALPVVESPDRQAGGHVGHGHVAQLPTAARGYTSLGSFNDPYDAGADVTLGMESRGVFSADLDAPFTQEGFESKTVYGGTALKLSAGETYGIAEGRGQEGLAANAELGAGYQMLGVGSQSEAGIVGDVTGGGTVKWNYADTSHGAQYGTTTLDGDTLRLNASPRELRETVVSGKEMSGQGGTRGQAFRGSYAGKKPNATLSAGRPMTGWGRSQDGGQFGEEEVAAYAKTNSSESHEKLRELAHRRLELAREKGAVDSLYSSKLAHRPFSNEPPIVYPDTEVWTELTARRSETKGHALRGRSASERLSRAKRVEPGGVREVAVAPHSYDTETKSVDYGVNTPRWETRTKAPGTEQYDPIIENAFLPAVQQPLSTFSVDVDTASYANVRRFLRDGMLPPPNAVRIEEMVNYFKYDYPLPEGDVPFSVNMEVAGCPWNGEHRLLRIGLKGREVEQKKRGPSNLVFLLDVSGSMRDGNKLPLVKQAMTMLVEQLTEDDRVAIVTYASGTEVKLESTGGHERDTILAAIDSLSAGGSTHGSAGIQLAYDRATSHFVDGGTNRVILATDGDLNVGITDDDELVQLIREKAATGVFLTVLGFGTGNLKDAKLEKLADKGNGSYAYIDNLREARKVLIEQISGSLITIAKDVKIQIELNPAEVKSYRLIGYENRTMAAADFHDDKKDAGEIGAGHTVTALYELVPADGSSTGGSVREGLKYQRQPELPLNEAAQSGELLTLKLRYKQPHGEKSKLLESTVKDSGKRFAEASAELRFATAVASFGMVLRGSQYAGGATFSAVEEFAAGAIGDDPGGYRTEFLDLVRRAKELRPR